MIDEEMRQKHQELRNENLTDWRTALSKIFGAAIPRHVEWTNVSDVVLILNMIKPMQPDCGLVHMFYPSGGGNDLEAVRPSVEPGCIELDCGTSAIAKVGKLSFESFEGDNTNEWAYFRLDCADLEPTGVYDHLPRGYEEVTELSPGEYDVRESWDRDEDSHGNDLPDGARPLSRYFGGAFVFFAKMSWYNHESREFDAYRAVHNTSPDDFRTFIQSRA